MNNSVFNEELLEKSNIIGVHFSVEQMEQFYKYMNLLIEWNEKMNLTAIIEPEEIIQKHFIDSLTILNRIEDNKSVVDVGTGAGFPGIPLSIMNPTLKITLVDSLNKRLVFLQEVINQLGLKNVELVHARAEDFGQNKKYREKFDIATSRAVANLSTLSESFFIKENKVSPLMESDLKHQWLSLKVTSLIEGTLTPAASTSVVINDSKKTNLLS